MTKLPPLEKTEKKMEKTPLKFDMIQIHEDANEGSLQEVPILVSGDHDGMPFEYRASIKRGVPVVVPRFAVEALRLAVEKKYQTKFESDRAERLEKTQPSYPFETIQKDVAPDIRSTYRDWSDKEPVDYNGMVSLSA